MARTRNLTVSARAYAAANQAGDNWETQAARPLVVRPGTPCPQCGATPTTVEHDRGMRADYLVCADPNCYFEQRVRYNYTLMAWEEERQ